MKVLVHRWNRYFRRFRSHQDFGQTFTDVRSDILFPFSSGTVPCHQATHRLRKHANPEKAQRLGAKLLLYLRLCLSGGSIVGALVESLELTAATLQSIPRTARAVVWAIRAGLSYKRFQTSFPSQDSDDYSKAIAMQHAYWAEELLAVCRLNGGVYVKAGQYAAAFGAVPPEYRAKLSSLEDRAKPRSYKMVRKILETELGRNASQLFSEFDPKATAAASLAQVHRARLCSGEDVAVKVQYAGLEGTLWADLSTMRGLSRLATIFFPSYSLDWLYNELEKQLSVELDFRNEIKNVRRLRAIISRDRQVAVPVFYDHLCTPRLLVMEWVDGVKISLKDTLAASGINPRIVGMKLVQLFASLTFVHGYVHGDPHAGNLMVRKRGRPSVWSWIRRGSRQPFQIVLLDHGSYLDMPPALREQFCQLWCTFVMGDADGAREVATAMGGERAGDVLPTLLTQRAVDRTQERALQKSMGINNFGDISSLLNTAGNDLVELLRVNTVIRGIAAGLGVSMADRIRICGTFARRGLPSRSSKSPHVHARFRSWTYRAKLASNLTIVCGLLWARSAVERTAAAVLSIFGQAVLLD